MGFFARIKTYVVLAGAAALAVLWAFLKGRAAGKRATKIQQYEQREKLQEKYDEIDSEPVDFDSAIERLRDRSKKR